jgi:four helix bundle protein
MSFGHKNLDVYRLSLDYIKWIYNQVDNLKGIHRFARDQLLRASQSIPLNIADGNGKFSEADRIHFFSIARGSALECVAIQDVLRIAKERNYFIESFQC